MGALKEQRTSEPDAGYDPILGQATGLLARRGDEHAGALLLDARAMALVDTDKVIRTDKVFDPWLPTADDGPASITICRRSAVLDVDDHFVPRFTAEICQRIAAKLCRRYRSRLMGQAGHAVPAEGGES